MTFPLARRRTQWKWPSVAPLLKRDRDARCDEARARRTCVRLNAGGPAGTVRARRYWPSSFAQLLAASTASCWADLERVEDDVVLSDEADLSPSVARSLGRAAALMLVCSRSAHAHEVESSSACYGCCAECARASAAQRGAARPTYRRRRSAKPQGSRAYRRPAGAGPRPPRAQSDTGRASGSARAGPTRREQRNHATTRPTAASHFHMFRPPSRGSTLGRPALSQVA
jgi:hypothetical protein